jgi:ubiquinone biosynthesis protein
MANVGSLYSSVRGLKTAIKDVSRLRDIIGVLGKHGFGAMVTRLGLEETVGVKSLMAYSDENDVPYTLAQRIRMAIEDLGPTFVKLGQILSTRSDLVPADIIAELQSLQDDVPEMRFDQVRAQVEAELGGTLDVAFASFDETPIACASIAQVHRAVLAHETEEVVVKVQRPAIAGQIESDLNILHFLARQVERNVPDLALMDPVGIVEEFDRAIHKELDFRNERRNMSRFSDNFKAFEGLRVPRVHDSYCTAKVLTMEFVRGVKITRAPQELGVDATAISKRMLQALFKMIFGDGCFHGDLHPGNIFILPDGEIVLIDFGLMGRLTREQRDSVLDMLIGLSKQDYQLVARVFFDLGVKQPGVVYDYDRFEADVIEVMEQHIMGRLLSEMDFGAFFTDLVAGAIRHQIKMPPTYTMVFKALITVEGIGKTLAPEVNFIEEAEPFVKEMLAERYNPSRLVKEAADTLATLSRFSRRFPRVAMRLLQDISEGRLGVRVQVEGMDELVAQQRNDGKRQSRTIAFAALIVSGSLALDAPAPSLLGVNVISIGLYGLAVLIGLRLLLAALRGR